MVEDFEELTKALAQTTRNARGLERAIAIRPDNVADLVARGFLRKQIHHADTMLSLGRNRDQQLIARSMVEGFALLEWLLADDKRHQEWHDRVMVGAIQMMDLFGHDAPPWLRKVAAELGEKWPNWKKKTGGLDPKSVSAADYKKEWSEKITVIIRTVPDSAPEWQKKNRAILAQRYAMFSKWQHWDFVGMWDYIYTDELPSADDDKRARSSLDLALYSLLAMVDTVAGHTGLVPHPVGTTV